LFCATRRRPALRLRHTSPDGDEDYPGNLRVEVTNAVSPENELRIDYHAETARDYTPVTPGLIPTGDKAPVAGTPFDFTQPRAIGERISAAHPQLSLGHGYDHNFVLSPPATPEPRPAARVRDPVSGRVLDVLTTAPGVQHYTANFLDGTLTGKPGRPYPRHGGFCLETQGFPDSVNQPKFPSVIQRPGQVYRATTIYRFPAG
jgi:aldose 1-epimerase